MSVPNRTDRLSHERHSIGTILYVDDQLRQNKLYVEALREAGYSVSPVESVDVARQMIGAENSTIGCVVLDVMMPPLETYGSEDTDGGLLTGLFLYREIRRKLRLDLPIVILTNNVDPMIASSTANDASVMILEKVETFYDELVSLVDHVCRIVREQAPLEGGTE